MLETLVALSIVGVAVFLAVLTAYLGAVLRGLRSIGVTLDKVSFGVRAIEQETAGLGDAAGRVNADLAAWIEREG